MPTEILTPLKNYGYIPDEVVPEDRVFGADNQNDLDILQVDRDWTLYLPDFEKQRNPIFDTYACVTFSAWNCIETYGKRKFGLTWNKSDRFTAKMSDTIPRWGNSAKKVLTSIRKQGCVDEAEYSFTDTMTEVEYYDRIPEEVKTKALNLLDFAEFEYQIVVQPTPDKMWDALQYAPLHVAVLAWPEPVNGVYLRVEGQINHMVEVYKADYGKYWYVYDHYDLTFKKLAWDYIFSDVRQDTFKLKPMKYKTYKGSVKSEVYVKINDKYFQIGSFGTYLKGLDLLMWDKFEEVEQVQFDNLPKEENSLIFSL